MYPYIAKVLQYCYGDMLSQAAYDSLSTEADEMLLLRLSALGTADQERVRSYLSVGSLVQAAREQNCSPKTVRRALERLRWYMLTPSVALHMARVCEPDSVSVFGIRLLFPESNIDSAPLSLRTKLQRLSYNLPELEGTLWREIIHGFDVDHACKQAGIKLYNFNERIRVLDILLHTDPVYSMYRKAFMC